jgi:large repetitive protein
MSLRHAFALSRLLVALVIISITGAQTSEPAQIAYEHVLNNAGATLPKRDAVDERIVRETREGTGHVINWVKDAGGWPDFPSTMVPSQRAQ